MKNDRHARIETECEVCGILFMARAERIKKGQSRFCSKGCYKEWWSNEERKSRGVDNGKAYLFDGRWAYHYKDESGKKRTMSYAKYLWEKNFGPVPEGYVIGYKDGDSTNCSLDNLEMLTNSEFSIRATEWQIGVPKSKETKKKISKVHKGKKLSEEHKKKIGDAGRKLWAEGRFDSVHKGENNHHWRGGHSKFYPKEFYDIRFFIFDRDKYQCGVCGKDISNSKFGHVHHRDGDKYNNSPENLISLCVHCHGKVHSNKFTTSNAILSLRSELSWNH